MSPFKGVSTALVTPFKDGKIDEKQLRANVDWQIEQGIHGLVPCGTTGESPTLSTDEKKAVINMVLDQTQKRVPVIAGTGSNNTAESIELTQWAKERGADAALIVTPYYNKPTQEGLIRHFHAIADIGLPIILYNVPGRTALSLTPQTILVLSRHDKIVAIKEASGSMSFASEILKEKPDLTLLTGDDFTFLSFLSLGGEGVISVISNIMPREFSQLYQAFTSGDLEEARRLHYQIYPVIQAIFLETNPIPVKTALGLMNRLTLEFRLPLCEMAPENLKKLKTVMMRAELI